MNNLIVVTSQFSILNVVSIIKQTNSTNNVLIIVGIMAKHDFFDEMKEFSEQFNTFSKIVIFNDFFPSREDMHLYTGIETYNGIKEGFREKDFWKELEEFSFDSFLITNPNLFIFDYILEKLSFEKIAVAEEGLGTYKFLIPKKVDIIYSLNYFNKFYPLCTILDETINVIKIHKEILIDTISSISSEIKEFELKSNSIVFMLQPFPNDLIGYKEYLVAKINELVDKGYNIYIKSHPRQSDAIVKYIQKECISTSIFILDVKELFESFLYINKNKIKAIVSMYSTALLTSAYLYDIPSYTIGMYDKFYDFRWPKTHNDIFVGLIIDLYIPDISFLQDLGRNNFLEYMKQIENKEPFISNINFELAYLIFFKSQFDKSTYKLYKLNQNKLHSKYFNKQDKSMKRLTQASPGKTANFLKRFLRKIKGFL